MIIELFIGFMLGTSAFMISFSDDDLISFQGLYVVSIILLMNTMLVGLLPFVAWSHASKYDELTMINNYLGWR